MLHSPINRNIFAIHFSELRLFVWLVNAVSALTNSYFSAHSGALAGFAASNGQRCDNRIPQPKIL
ncbi:hypothetical protein FHX10_006422 [Rhizobium sp. BK591]|jgi:hypothetical protein|nr:hypothetical protein [Rhizobium sp. BK112]MBB3370909.1 hypothetical protein [Rhizobium sp. BK077]MBB3746870.1 hypothetical protein [Rhizobium sp. BK591]MBB4181677.1 hypothetical protein [Rhizobium sp. BK109]MBB4254849.1 hypothetical protein [Rhizobium sp. BK008]